MYGTKVMYCVDNNTKYTKFPKQVFRQLWKYYQVLVSMMRGEFAFLSASGATHPTVTTTSGFCAPVVHPHRGLTL